MDEAAAVIIIGLCIFAFLLVLLGIGEFYGGQWSLVAQGVVKFILIILGVCFAAFVLVKLMEKK